LWVVHSFDPALHLKANDIRLRLLQHAQDPWATVRAYDAEVGKTESDFERLVLKRLTDAGYRVKTQWQVGYYRIDMVIEGGGKRLAVECDGDRYHPLEKLADDMARQAVLERLGWHFVRIRGSTFYRDPDSAMAPVFRRIEEMEIPAEGVPEGSTGTDLTLIHELEDLVRETDDTEAVMPMPAVPAVEHDSFPSAVSYSAFHTPVDKQDIFVEYSAGTIEHLLMELGGNVTLEDFLPHLAKARGFQRLGKNIRKVLESIRK
jgi:very-short-patch-repair endonuclease